MSIKPNKDNSTAVSTIQDIKKKNIEPVRHKFEDF
jgi:hypothetical protein